MEASNENLPNTSSPNEVEIEVHIDTSKKRKVMVPRGALLEAF